MSENLHTLNLDSLCAALADAMGIDAPAQAAQASKELCDYVNGAFGGEKADRVLMYNPDAIGSWVEEKYPGYMPEVFRLTELKLPMQCVMPSVTPVCFGTMYTGAQPEVHGIRRYEKPVIRIDTLFDALIRAGKKPAIVAENDCSMSKIYLDREMDYFFYDTIAEVNAKAAELVMEDKHDFIAVYNGNFDTVMHKVGPEDSAALAELRANSYAFGELAALVKRHWSHHNVLMGFAMDHGCHEIDGKCGSHGLDMPEDLNICHHYAAFRRG